MKSQQSRTDELARKLHKLLSSDRAHAAQVRRAEAGLRRVKKIGALVSELVQTRGPWF
jgi:hypothetical protein